jgi:hypothetical protein
MSQVCPTYKAVVKEALRLHPPLPVIVRECREACKIKDFDIPKKTMLAINVYAIMRDAKIWDYPNDFRPERFLISSKDKDGMEYIPFGAGRRRCPGSRLALNLIHTIVAAMMIGRFGEKEIMLRLICKLDQASVCPWLNHLYAFLLFTFIHLHLQCNFAWCLIAHVLRTICCLKIK